MNTCIMNTYVMATIIMDTCIMDTCILHNGHMHHRYISMGHTSLVPKGPKDEVKQAQSWPGSAVGGLVGLGVWWVGRAA